MSAPTTPAWAGWSGASTTTCTARPDMMFTALDAKRHVLGSEAREPEPGDNLMLSIDENIQFMAERALDHAMARVNPLNGTIVIQDTHTGQILALAIRPTYNPNDFRHATTGLLRDHAVSDVYEPGSTFKLVTYSAALDAAGVEPTDIVDCEGGQITLYGRTIHDDVSDRGLGRVTIERALEKSSDVAAVKMALKLGPERFYSYIKAFGFGARSGIQLPAETRGLLRPTQRWNATSIGYLAIGHEIGGYADSTGDNGLDHRQRRRVSAAEHPAGDLKATEPASRLKPMAVSSRTGTARSAARRCASRDLAADLGQDAQDDGRRGAGGQWTPRGAQWLLCRGQDGYGAEDRSVTHTYSHTKHVASFAGFAPVNNPAISVAIIIDSPNGRSVTALRSPRQFSKKWRKRYWSIWACRTMSRCRRSQQHRRSLSPRTRHRRTRAIYRRCLPRLTICRRTIRCAQA